MSNWRDNPKNFTKDYEKAIFPKLVFEECNKWWVPASTEAKDITPAMNSCLNNWYSKHTTAFDLFMDINYFKNKKKGMTEYFDLDSYTEMETTMPHDMFRRTNAHSRLDTDEVKQTEFMKNVRSSYGGLRNQAL